MEELRTNSCIDDQNKQKLRIALESDNMVTLTPDDGDGLLRIENLKLSRVVPVYIDFSQKGKR